MQAGKPNSKEMTPPQSVVPPRTAFRDNLKQLWDTICVTALVIGSTLIVFIAARNTITWHLQRFWGASGSFWQSLWIKIYDHYEHDPINITVWGTVWVANGTLILFNVFLMFLDLTGKPAFLLRYKIQDAKEVPIDRQRFIGCVKNVAFNQIVMGIPFSYVMAYIMMWRGFDFGPELPAFHWVVPELIVFIMMEEIGFYYSHRMLHLPMFYKHIHKKHHEWTASIGLVAFYCHPLEHILSNLLPPALGPLIMGSHIATAWLWFAMAIGSTCMAHSGYHFPFQPSPEAHDYHHLKFVNNFGTIGILDRLHGTDTMFRASKQYQRHYMSLTVTPLQQVIPDEPKMSNGKVDKTYSPEAKED